VKTIGGGMIIEAIGEKLRRSNPQAVEDAEERARSVTIEKDFVEYCIKTAEAFAATESELSIRAKVRPEPLKKILAELIEQKKIFDLGSKFFIHHKTSETVQQQLIKIAGDFHRKSPGSPGLSTEEFYKTSELRKDVFDNLLKLMLSEGKLVERKHRLALPEHREAFSEDEQNLLERIETLYKNRPFNPPKFEEVTEQAKAAGEKVQKILQILIEQERLVRIEKDLFFHSEAVEKARGLLISFIKKEGQLESVKFKYLIDTTRKFAIPLLDYFDRIGLTKRAGYTRYLKNPNVD
jgi:selenocysteine-specific elongation factor